MKSNVPPPDSDARLDPPHSVREIARKLERAGFETWCVGGAVRDALLGRRHLDWDLATAATPQQVQRLFRRTIPVGVQFGTVGVLDKKGVMHEVTTFRRDVRTDGRHAVVEFGASLDEDLARRDFTINAIAYSPASRVLHDPFGGRADLQAGVVRAVGTPDERMREDRLRALRAIRFAARFDFEIEPVTWQAIVESAPHLGRLSAERIRQELEKTMEQVNRPSRALEMWRSGGALATLIPDLANAAPVAFVTIDYLPRPQLRGRPQRLINRIAALFLDAGPRVAERTLRQLRFSNQQIAWSAALIQGWQRIGGAVQAALQRGSSGPRELREWVALVGRLRAPSVMRLAHARFSAEHALGIGEADLAMLRTLHRRMLGVAFRDPVELGDLAADGDDLRALGIPAGPYLGRTLAELLRWVLEDPARNTREQLLQRAKELYPEPRADDTSDQDEA